MHPTWEYHFEVGTPTLTRLNELGCEGWEVVGPAKLAGQRATMIGLLFKRPTLTVEAMLSDAPAGRALVDQPIAE